MTKPYLRFTGILMLALAASMILSNLPIFNDEKDTVVDAAAGPTADSNGYTWIDNVNPDPKVTYDWMDISTIGTNIVTQFPSNYMGVYYLYPIPTYQPLGFKFPFYGAQYDNIQIYPNGVLGFGPTTYGYAIYNYQGPLPRADTYVPPGTIAPYWCYYGGTKGLYTYQGATPEGMKYWVCTWDKFDYYYYLYSGYTTGAVVQCILYENGNIHVNIKTGYLYYGYYLTVGICNYARDVGTSYYWTGSSSSGLPNGRAVMFKQFKTQINDVRLSPGYGPDEKTYAAMGGLGENNYYADIDVYSERGLSYLSTVDVTIGPGNEELKLRYDVVQGRFSKLNDPGRLAILSDEKSSIALDPVRPLTNMSLHFEFDFNLWWSDFDPINVRVELRGAGVAPSIKLLESAFRVESRIMLAGAMTVSDARGLPIKNGGWVRGNDALHFAGVHREYYGLGAVVVPPDFIKVGIIDQAGVRYFGEVSDLDLTMTVDPVFPQMTFKLYLENVTAKQDLTPIEMKAEFTVRIDFDKPGIPGDLKIFRTGLNENPSDFDNDPEVYLTWTDSVDTSSGVAYYYISVNKDQRHSNIKDLTQTLFKVPKGTNAYLLKNLPKGINKIYMWAEDVVGNTGGEVFTTVKIDINDPVTFHNFYPVTGIWITNRNPSCSLLINDSITGVDPLTIYYEISTEGEAGLIGDWQALQETYAPDNSLYIVVTGWFQSGKINYIRFRANDVAGNGPYESEAYNVWVDADAPLYSLKSPLESEYNLNPVQQVKIELRDLDSGVDFTSIEYRVSTHGKAKFGPWMPYKDASGSTSQVTMIIKEEFARGDLNYVQVRARDLVGNVRTSQFFNVKISSYPTVVLASPMPDEVNYENERIVFDATGSYDPDGQNQLQYTWYRNPETGTELETFGNSAYITTDKFEAKEYTITLEVKSDQLTTVEVFKLRINARPDPLKEKMLDTDGDGMPDWWEQQEGTDPFIKDADKDPDVDQFANIREFENGTRPLDPRSHPAVLPRPVDKSNFGLENSGMWILLVALAVIVIAVIVAALVARAKKEKAEKRIKAVRNMRKIMPSVSWDHITAASYMAAASSSGMMPSAPTGPALPGTTQIPPEQTLPPAPDHVVAQQQAQQTQ